MEQDPYIPDQWVCKIGFQEKDRINFWFVVKDDIGKNTTSPLYSMDIADPQEVDSIVNMTYIGLLIGTVVGLLLIFTVQGLAARRRDIKFSELKTTEERIEEKGIGKRSSIIVFGLLIISILTIIITIYFGMLAELIELVT
jgi:hypothetical protein